MVPAKDLLQQLQDPQFRMADGLSGFSDNRITQSLAQKQMIINNKPGGDAIWAIKKTLPSKMVVRRGKPGIGCLLDLGK